LIPAICNGPNQNESRSIAHALRLRFFLNFPSVTKVQAIGVIGIAHKIVTSGNIDKIYEAVA
jgi:hypothetical protein